MAEFGDDVLTLIFSSISDAKDRNSISLVCKQWHRVEGPTRTSLRLLAPNPPLKLFLRFPNLTTFQYNALILDDNAIAFSHLYPKIETLNLNLNGDSAWSDDSDDITGFGLATIAAKCPNLSVLLLRNRKKIDDFGIHSLVTFSTNLTCLDLSGCTAITDNALHYIRSLNLRKLNLSRCTRITDVGIDFLSDTLCLEELRLADCAPRVTRIGCLSISNIQTLKKLDLSRLNVDDLTLQSVAEGCKNLVELTISGCRNVTGVGIEAFSSHTSLEVLVMGSCEAVSVESIHILVSESSSLKCMTLDRKLRHMIHLHVQGFMSNRCLLYWV